MVTGPVSSRKNLLDTCVSGERILLAKHGMIQIQALYIVVEEHATCAVQGGKAHGFNQSHRPDPGTRSG